MTSQGTAHGRFTRAIERRNLFQAEFALREMGTPSLLVVLDSLRELRCVKCGGTVARDVSSFATYGANASFLRKLRFVKFASCPGAGCGLKETSRQAGAYWELMGPEARRRGRTYPPEWAELVGVEVDPRTEPHPTRQPKLARACALLRAELADGERPAVELYDAALEAGVSKRTLDAAKKLLVVEDTRHSFGGAVFWKAPRPPEIRWVPVSEVVDELRRARRQTKRRRGRAAAS